MNAAKSLQHALCCFSALLVGCGSVPLPPALTRAQAQRLRELPLPYSVGVARFEYPAYSESLNKALLAARVFKRVAPLESYSRPPDLIATVEDTIHGTATIPIAAFFTAGIVPSNVQEDHGYAFSLAPSSNRSRKTLIAAHYSGTSTLGWVALPIALLPNHALMDPEHTRRFRHMLAYQTIVAL